MDMAPQHGRGGKHAVKDEDLTHTKYDDYNREQLLVAVKEAGLYVKDDKKSVMAHKLAGYDRNRQLVETRAIQERKEQEEKKLQEKQEKERARQDRRKARARRNKERGQMRELGENVSSDSEDSIDLREQQRHDARMQTVTGGDVVSDVSSEDTESNYSATPKNLPIAPSCRLELFEWPYTAAPSSCPPATRRTEQHPATLTYAPLKLIATHSSEKVTLPGAKYPAGVDPDFVPILDSLTRAAARHGYMVGLLAHAKIESASYWASRTIIQGWNGRMYFRLPQTSNTKQSGLHAVYQRWSVEHHRLLRPTSGVRNVEAATADRKRRAALRLANKRKRTVGVYEACLWRSQAIGFAPAYLDWEKHGENVFPQYERAIENLFYIRFPGCDVPHYYFWVKEGEWSDPLTPDPEWSTEVFERQNQSQTAVASSRPQAPTKIRVKKLTAPPPLRHNIPPDLDLDTILSSIEHDLSIHGLGSTLANYRILALFTGREQAWCIFTHKLPVLYPSGAFPRAPPVEPAKGLSVAEKIHAVLSGNVLLPFNGDEAWTRADDEMWDTVTMTEGGGEDSHMSDANAFDDSQEASVKYDDGDEEGVQALYRRDSMDAYMHHKDRRVWAWLGKTSDSYEPRFLPMPSPSPRTPVEPEPQPERQPESISSLNLNETVDRLDLGRTENETASACPFCNFSWATMTENEKAKHMLSHSSTIHPALSTQRISHIHAVGTGVKRRHSYLHTRTLSTYSKRSQGKKILRVDSGASLVERWGSEDSPFSKEVRRTRKVKGEWRGKGL